MRNRCAYQNRVLKSDWLQMLKFVPVMACKICRSFHNFLPWRFSGSGRVKRKLEEKSDSRSLHYAPPDFLWNLVALANFLRPSLRKGAYAGLSSAAWQEIRVRFGRDDNSFLSRVIPSLVDAFQRCHADSLAWIFRGRHESTWSRVNSWGEESRRGNQLRGVSERPRLKVDYDVCRWRRYHPPVEGHEERR
jgi:hypothetical protein